jgi:hypothetical protein
MDNWSSIRCERLTAPPGQRDALVAALRRTARTLRSAGCELLLSLSEDHPDVVWVTQAWYSREAELQGPRLAKEIREPRGR